MNRKRKSFLIFVAILFLLLVALIAGSIALGRYVVRNATGPAISAEEYPAVDGSLLLQPYSEAMAAKLTGMDLTAARQHVLHTGTQKAAENLLNGTASLVLLPDFAAEALAKEAEKQDVELEIIPFAKDALVFSVEKGAEVTELSEEAKNEILPAGTVWTDLAETYQGKTETLEYGSYYYQKNRWGSENRVLLTVGGIAPTEETIAKGTYPYSYELCIVFRGDERPFRSPIRKLAARLTAEEGQAVLTELGYVNLEGEAIAEGSGLTAYQTAQGNSSTSEESGTNRVIKGSEGYHVSEGMTKNYLIENPIVWEDLAVTAEHTIGTISGLIDEEVQKTINGRIEEAYKQMIAAELPGYRGVKNAVPEGSKRIEDKVKVSVLFNFNNVLSLAVTGEYTYALPNEEGNVVENAWGYYEDTMALTDVIYLNFDLNSGKEIALKNIFIDGADYQRILNQRVAAKEVEGLSPVGPFQGIAADQQFYLYNDAIYLVFDQDTPQFLTAEFKPVSLPVYFSEVAESLAITARYYDDETSIFTAEGPKVKALIPYREELDVTNTETWKTGNVQITKTWSYSSAQSSYIKNMVEAEAATTKAVASALNKAGRQALYQMTSVGRRQGNYCNITVTDYRWLENGGTEQYTKYYCYNIETMKEVAISEIFWAGFDYAAVIEEHLREEIGVRGGLYKEGKGSLVAMSQKEQEAKIKALMKELSDFSFETDCVNVSFYPVYTSEGSVSIVLQIPFAEFGCDNMTLFEE